MARKASVKNHGFKWRSVKGIIEEVVGSFAVESLLLRVLKREWE